MCTLPPSAYDSLFDYSSRSIHANNTMNCRSKSIPDSVSRSPTDVADFSNLLSDSKSSTKSNGISVNKGTNSLNGWHNGTKGANLKAHLNGSLENDSDDEADGFVEAESTIISSTPGRNSIDEFFDADEEDYASEDDSSLSNSRIVGKNAQSLYRDLASRLRVETLRRKQLEERLEEMRKQRDLLATELIKKGIPLPSNIPTPTTMDNDSVPHTTESNPSLNLDLDIKPTVTEAQAVVPVGEKVPVVEGETMLRLEAQNVEDQEVVVARAVAEGVTKGIIKAEMQQEMEEILEKKEKEISRLKDKLQFWEKMNHEMSQQNQIASELARARRKRHQQLRKYALAGVGITIGVCAAACAAYGCFTSNNDSLSSESHSSNPTSDFGDVVTNQRPMSIDVHSLAQNELKLD